MKKNNDENIISINSQLILFTILLMFGTFFSNTPLFFTFSSQMLAGAIESMFEKKL